MTAEEYIIKQLERTKIELELSQRANEELKAENNRFECIVDTLKAHATLENGTVCIFITECSKNDRDFIVDALDLKEEEKPNE